MPNLPRSPTNQPKITESFTPNLRKRPSSDNSQSESPAKSVKMGIDKEMCQFLTTMKKEIMDSVADVKTDTVDLKTQIGDMNIQMGNLVQTVAEQAQEIKTLNDVVKAQGDELSNIKRQNARLQDELRKPNLLFHGLPENEAEDPVATVKEFLGINNIQSKVDVAFRLGHIKPGALRPRPIKAKFFTLEERNTALRLKPKLRSTNSNISITEDLHPDTKMERTKTWEKAQQRRNPLPGPTRINK
jgi:uncharacterized coiled-coil protein SlyX